jgi:hypothetical protein
MIADTTPAAAEPSRELRRQTAYIDADITAIIEAAGGLPEGVITMELFTADGLRRERRGLARREALAIQLGRAARVYRNYRRAYDSPTNTDIAKRQHAIAAAARALMRALGTTDNANDRGLPETVGRPLKAQAQSHGHERPNGYADVFGDLPPERYGAAGDPVHYTDYHAASVIRHCIHGVRLLQLLATRSELSAREEIAASQTRRRNRGDGAFRRLFGTLCNVWIDIFKKAPGASVPADGGKPGGPFIRFVIAACRPLGVEKSPHTIHKALRKWKRQNMPRDGGSAKSVRVKN